MRVTQAVVRAMDEVEEVAVEGTRGTTIRMLLGPEDGTPNFATRCFTIAPGGRIPCHRHDAIEHEQVILEGEMVIGLDQREETVRVGDCVFIPARVAHWYENRSTGPVRFLCVVPICENYQMEWLEELE